MGCDMSFMKKAVLTARNSKQEEKYEKRILLLGLDNAGKTSLLFHMRDHEFKPTVPTVGLNIENVVYKRYNLTFWDVGGQATKLWKHYFDHIDAVIFVLDSTDEEKLIFAKDELRRLLNNGSTSTMASSQGTTQSAGEGLGDVPFLLMYNKTDMVGEAKTSQELSGRLEVEQLRQQGRQIMIQECSAKTGCGIWDGIDRLITMFDSQLLNGGAESIKANQQQAATLSSGSKQQQQ